MKVVAYWVSNESLALKEGLWNIVSGAERAPAEVEMECHAKFVGRRDHALVVLSVDPTLLPTQRPQ